MELPLVAVRVEDDVAKKVTEIGLGEVAFLVVGELSDLRICCMLVALAVMMASRLKVRRRVKIKMPTMTSSRDRRPCWGQAQGRGRGEVVDESVDICSV